jgi:hypothetical protein
MWNWCIHILYPLCIDISLRWRSDAETCRRVVFIYNLQCACVALYKCLQVRRTGVVLHAHTLRCRVRDCTLQAPCTWRLPSTCQRPCSSAASRPAECGCVSACGRDVRNNTVICARVCCASTVCFFLLLKQTNRLLRCLDTPTYFAVSQT